MTFEVTPGDYEVLVDTEPLEYTDSGTHPVEVDGDTEYTLQLASPPGDDTDTEENTATGIVRVVDQNGDPVEGEQVLLRPPGTVEDDAREERFTDENGEVVIELAAGAPDDVVPYGVEVRGEEKQLMIMSDEHVGVQEVTFEVSEDEMTEFERTVRVVDQNGDPVEGERVETRRLADNEWTDAGTTDANGEITLTAVSSDPSDAALYDVRVAGTTVTGVAVDNTDRDAKVIEISEEEEPITAGDLTIVAVDAESGGPIADATVTATHRESGEQFEIPTNSDGEAVFETVPHGEYDVTVAADGWETAEQTVAFDGETDEDTDLRQTIELTPEQPGTGTEESLTVVVEDQAGEPVEGEPVTIIYEDGSEFEHETDANGEHIVSPDITDGSDDVVPITVEVRDQSETVLLHDGEKKTATFTVETEGGNGNVTEPGEPPGNETVAPGPSPNESTANATG